MRSKKILLLTGLMGILYMTYGQQGVAINSTGLLPDPSSMFDVAAADKGMLVPRVALAATNTMLPVASPAISLLVYNTATAGAGITAVSPGYYYWDGAQWQKLKTSPNSTGGNDWTTMGNAGTNPAVNFMGTTDNTAFIMRTNNTERVRVTNTGRVGIGTNTPASLLDLGSSFGVTVTDVNGKKLAVYNDATGNDFYGLGLSSSILQLHAGSTAAEGPGMVLRTDGNVGIGTANPNVSAILELNATNKGVLFTQVALASPIDAVTVPAPAASLLVYNTNTALITPNGSGVGYYYNAGTPGAPQWVRLATGSASSTKGFGAISPALVCTLGSLQVRYNGTTNGQYVQLRSTTGGSLNAEIMVIEDYGGSTTYNASYVQTITNAFGNVGTAVGAYNEMNCFYVVIASTNEVYRITFNLFSVNEMMIIERF